MARNAYLAIDLGAESGRTIVGVLDSGKLSLHETHRFLHLPRKLPSGLHWDLTGLWGNILEGCRKAIAWSKENGVKIVSLGVDTWGVDCGYIGKSGELLTLPHCYRDPRNPPAYEKTVKSLGNEYIYGQTGLQFMSFNTLYQVVAQNDAEPGVLKQADKLLFIPDLLHYFFAGSTAVESSIASTSQMTDPRTGQWALPMLQKLGLPTQMLGKIVPPGTRLGKLRKEVADDIGADANLEVIAPATHDTASAVAAVPADPATSWAYLSSGTWSLMGAELDQPCLTDAARQVPFTNEGGVNNTIRFLKNISGLWLVQECRRQFEKEGYAYDYPQLEQMAGQAEPFRTLVDTDHAPFATPGEMPAKIAAFARSAGQPVPTTPGQFIRCCLESLALTYRRTLERLQTVLNRNFDVLHIVGGGGKNLLLNQMTADATAIKVIAGPAEATAAGNVLVQAMGAGDVKDLNHIRQIVRASFDPKSYVAKDKAAWDGAYARFLTVLGK